MNETTQFTFDPSGSVQKCKNMSLITKYVNLFAVWIQKQKL